MPVFLNGSQVILFCKVSGTCGESFWGECPTSQETWKCPFRKPLKGDEPARPAADPAPVRTKASSVKNEANFCGASGTFSSTVPKKSDNQLFTFSGTGSSGHTVEASAIEKSSTTERRMKGMDTIQHFDGMSSCPQVKGRRTTLVRNIPLVRPRRDFLFDAENGPKFDPTMHEVILCD